MKFCQDRKLRAKKHRAYATRASEFGPSSRDNSPLIEEILSLRRERASLLGFPNYAAYALAPRMAENPAAARNFFRRTRPSRKTLCKKRMGGIMRFCGGIARHSKLADMGFCLLHPSNCAAANSASANPICARIFPRRARLRKCLPPPGMLFGIKASAASASVWNPEVKFFQFKSKGGGGEAIGRLYLDLFARESKRGGAWMTDALSRFRAHRRLQLPAATINCNFAPPPQGGGGDAPMNFDEAATLFHEIRPRPSSSI